MVKLQDEIISLEYLYNKFKGSGFEKVPIKILLPIRDCESYRELVKDGLRANVYGDSQVRVEGNKLTKYEKLIINLR